MSKRRILISINTAWNIYNFRRNLIRFLISNNYHVITLAPSDSYSKKLEELGCEVHDLPMNAKGSNPFEDLRLLQTYKKQFKRLRPDICLFFTIKPNIYGSLACKQLGISFINNISGLGTVFLRNSISSIIAKRLYKKALHASKHIFFQNENDLDVFRMQHLLSHEKYSVIPGSGIDLDYFKALNIVNRSKTAFTFLMVSRLIFDKGIREYIQAAEIVMEKHPNTVFEILGRAEGDAQLGYSKNEFKKIVTRKSLVWHEEQSDVRPFIENADTIVLPSYREGMSRSLLEACAMEKPVITTDTPGCNDIVIDKLNGFLCEINNADSLANAMIKMINLDKNERKEMGKKGREIVKKRFADQIIFDAYINAITENLN